MFAPSVVLFDPAAPSPTLTVLMYESFAMPAPPAMMTAPVVEDVDAVVFVPVMTPPTPILLVIVTSGESIETLPFVAEISTL